MFSYILLFTAILFCSNTIAKSSVLNPIIMKNSKAIYIVDGDSISLSMRIKGIDTPEKFQKCRKIFTEIINCGTVSKEYLHILLNNIDGELYIETEGFGYYGRALVNVYKGGINIGKMMVEDGMAYAYGREYKEFEDIARIGKIGFWGYHTPPLSPKLWRKRYGRKFSK